MFIFSAVKNGTCIYQMYSVKNSLSPMPSLAKSTIKSVKAMFTTFRTAVSCYVCHFSKIYIYQRPVSHSLKFSNCKPKYAYFIYYKCWSFECNVPEILRYSLRNLVMPIFVFFCENVVVIAISELRPGSNEIYENSTFYGPFRFLIFILVYLINK